MVSDLFLEITKSLSNAALVKFDDGNLFAIVVFTFYIGIFISMLNGTAFC